MKKQTKKRPSTKKKTPTKKVQKTRFGKWFARHYKNHSFKVTLVTGGIAILIVALFLVVTLFFRLNPQAGTFITLRGDTSWIGDGLMRQTANATTASSYDEHCDRRSETLVDEPWYCYVTQSGTKYYADQAGLELGYNAALNYLMDKDSQFSFATQPSLILARQRNLTDGSTYITSLTDKASGAACRLFIQTTGHSAAGFAQTTTFTCGHEASYSWYQPEGTTANDFGADAWIFVQDKS